jgi:hypothetical protein
MIKAGSVSKGNYRTIRFCLILSLLCILGGGCKTYSKPATEAGLSLSDFPAGWQLLSSVDSATSSDRTFSNSDLTVKCIVQVYSSTNAAKNRFEYYFQEQSKRFALTELKIGNQAYAYKSISILASTTMWSVFFIKSNVTVELDESSEMFGVTLDDAVIWARKVEAKIS